MIDFNIKASIFKESTFSEIKYFLTMTAYLIGLLLIGSIGLTVAKPEAQLSQLVHGKVIDVGPYDGEVEIGVLPERYANRTAEDKKASYSIRRLLELLRGSFPTGIYGIPSLDPFVNKKLAPIPINLPFLNGEVNLAEIIVTGLQTLKIELIELRLDTLRSDFSFKVPLLHGVVSFQANLALGGLFPMSINGRLRVNLQNITIDGAVGGAEKISPPEHFYTLLTLRAHFHAEHVTISVDGLNVERDILESIDSLNSNFLPGPVKRIVNHYVAHEILKQLNNIIENFSVKQVKDYLLA